MAKKRGSRIDVTGPARRDIASILKRSFQEFGSGDKVHVPRHFLLYRLRRDGAIEVARVLHDARDLELHLPKSYLRK